MRILSIDPATKSLAVSIIDFNDQWRSDITSVSIAHRLKFVCETNVGVKLKILHGWAISIKQIVDRMITLKYVNVFDLIPGQKMDKIPVESRVKKLKGVVEYLKYVNTKLSPAHDIDKVLIEYQMSSNDKSRNISTALAYAFAPADTSFSFSGKLMDFKDEFDASVGSADIEIVGPALKSKVYFGADGHIQHFRKRYMGNYASNKAHSKYNFLKWLDDHDCRGLIEGIPKANLDDVADSFIMAYAWAIKRGENEGENEGEKMREKK